MAFGYNTFHTGFSFFGIIWLIMFVLITSVFAITFFKGIKEWNKNNHSPRLTVPATVVAKRTNVSRHRHGGNDTLHTTSTTYFATFQFESGDRLELMMDGYAYGMLVEGDEGDLTFQGTRYLGFERR